MHRRSHSRMVHRRHEVGRVDWAQPFSKAKENSHRTLVWGRVRKGLLPAQATFNRTGSNLTADGSGDDMLKLQGLAEFSFTLDDARRDPLTGEMGEEDIVQDARIEADNTAADSDNTECE